MTVFDEEFHAAKTVGQKSRFQAVTVEKNVSVVDAAADMRVDCDIDLLKYRMKRRRGSRCSELQGREGHHRQ